MQCMLSFLKKTHQVIYITQSFTRKKKKMKKKWNDKNLIFKTQNPLFTHTQEQLKANDSQNINGTK